MVFRKYLISAVILGLALVSFSSRADVVVLKTGKKIEVEKVWQENDQVWIIFHGMRASIPQSNIERIESKSNGNPRKSDSQRHVSARRNEVIPPHHRDGNREQTPKNAPSATPPQPKSAKKDQSRIFPDPVLGDLKWGTRFHAIKNLEKIQRAGGQEGVIEYRRKNEDLTFGQAELSSIHYSFWRDQLYMLTLHTQGQSNYAALRRETFRLFGKGLQTDRTPERYLWVDAPNDIMLQFSGDDELGMLWLRSAEIDRQYKLAQNSGHASYLRWMKSRN